MPSKKIQILGSMTSGTVRHDVVQELTEEEKLQARENINAASLDENGKIPVEQLPDGIGSGGGGTLIQKQADFEQNNSEKVDFIKNRPFYDTRIFSHFNSDETPNPVNFSAIGYTWFKISDLIPKGDKIFDTTFTFNNIALKPTAENISMNTADFCVALFNLKDGGQQAYLIAYNTGTFSAEYMGMPVTFEIEQTGIYIAWNNAEISSGKIIDVQVGELKTLDLKYLPENMAFGYEDGWSIDWDFTPTNTYIQPGFIIEWNGSDTGTSVVIPENEDLGISAGNMLYRVSDSIETLAGCTVTINTHTEDSEEMLNILAEDVAIIYDVDGNDIGTCALSYNPIVFNIEKAATAFIAEGMEFTFPSPGLYFASNNEKRVFNLYNIFYEILADGKLYKISDSVNTSLYGSNLGIIVDGQTVQELILENGGELVLMEQNDGSSAALPFIANTLVDNTIFDLSDLIGFPLTLTIPKAGLYVYDLMIAFGLPEGSSMQLSNSNITKIDSKFLPNFGPVYTGGSISTHSEYGYCVVNIYDLLANASENGAFDMKKGYYDIPSNITKFTISFWGQNITLDDDLVFSIATGYNNIGQDTDYYTSDISVTVSGLKKLTSNTNYLISCVYNHSLKKWLGYVVLGDCKIPPATTTTLGGIKVGANLSISYDGTLSADTPSLDWYNITNRPSFYTQSEINTKLNTKQNTSNLVTSINSNSTDTQYPSAKLLYSTKTTLENLVNTIKNTLTTNINTTKTDLEASINTIQTKAEEGITNAAIAQAKADAAYTLADGKVDKNGTDRLITESEAAKLANIAENANNYKLPVATAETLGGVKIGDNLSISADGRLSANSTISVDGTVLYDKAQNLTESEKSQARANIGAVSLGDVYTKSEINNELADYYTSTETDTKLGTKADLINGKVPTSQLPDDIVNHKQVQADYAQNNSSQPDFIKNKPTKVSDFSNDAGYQTAQQVANALANYPTTQQMNTALAGKSDTGHNHNISDLTGVASIERGGTGYTSIVDTVYTTARYRASSLHSSETTPSSNGIIAWQYE